MILPDVNVLVHAFRSDSSEYARCHEWLEDLINGPTPFGMSPQVLSGVLRVVTHPRVFAEPSELEETLAFCELFLAHPRCVVVRPGSRHWTLFADLCRNAEVRGNLVPDAWFAALAMESGARWITLDRDYARFRGLDWATPDA